MTTNQRTIRPISCPVCRSYDFEFLYPAYEGRSVSSDLMVVENATIDNRCCRDCGLIFNARGVRGVAETFYEQAYRLMLHEPRAGLRSFQEGGPVSQAVRSFEIMREMIPLPEEGRLLEIGAGKGEFLQCFNEKLPSWTITAFEPSAAHSLLKQKIARGDIYKCDYRSFPLKAENYDLVVALGVWEHVERPLDLVQWAWKALRNNGFLFIRVPNFAQNPNDLVCVDHLSKITEATLHSLAETSGFVVERTKTGGVPLFAALRKATSLDRRPANVFAENIIVARKNEAYLRNLMKAVERTRSLARSRNERWAIFGTTVAGLFAPFFLGFEPAEIGAFIDEDSSKWGAVAQGSPVGGLGLIRELAIRHIVLAISPAYCDAVVQKLRPFDVNVYVP